MSRILCICYITILLLAGSAHRSIAQQGKVDSVKYGSLKGIIKDSNRAFSLISATVSIYRLKTNVLIKYGLTNTYGSFMLTEIPTSDSLNLVITYVGYKAKVIKFKIDATQQILDLKQINIEAGTVDLREVSIISNPPIKIKGDTIEFSTDAFKLNPNAVAEDLLRKLPGIIIWGDGKITVNGKSVSRLLVDGKPFFGGDFKLATQNIPTSVIDKIQVTPDKPSDNNPIVSTVSLNLILKEDRKKGLFGKLNIGIGNKNRYDNSMSLNSFKPDLQLSLVGSLNNVNKVASDINTLMADAVYKPSRANEYLPNFNEIGVNKFYAGGISLSKNITNQKKLDIGFLSNEIKQNFNQNYIAISSLNDSSRIDSMSRTNHRLENINDLTGAYYFDNSKTVLKLKSQFTRKKYSFFENSQNAVSSTNNQLLSSNERIDTDDAINNNIVISMEFDSPSDFNEFKPKKNSYYINYKLNYENEKVDSRRINHYAIQYFNDIDRKYIVDNTHVNNFLELRYRGIGRLFHIKGIQIDLINKIELDYHLKNNTVNDSRNGNFIKNDFVSNINNFWFIDQKPTLSFKKRFKKHLESRYYKDLLFTLNLQGQFSRQRNSALINSQNFLRNYDAFIPNFQSVYQYNKVGKYNRTLKIGYQSYQIIPESNKIVSIIDSVDMYYLKLGNFNLKSAYTKEVSISFYQSSADIKKNYIASFDFKAGFTKDVIIDSINYGTISSGNTYSSTNGDISKYMNFTASVNKTYIVNEQQFMPRLFLGFYINTMPRYINQQLYETKNISTNLNAVFSYSFKNLILLSLDHGMRIFKNTQSQNNYFSNSSLSHISTVNFTLNQFYHFTFNTNVKNTYSKLSSSKDINFILLNSSILYRFLKSEQLELKFSALDLLRQNKNIIVDQFENRVSRNEINSLQQYYMLSLSYYPRIFNKSK